MERQKFLKELDIENDSWIDDFLFYKKSAGENRKRTEKHDEIKTRVEKLTGKTMLWLFLIWDRTHRLNLGDH